MKSNPEITADTAPRAECCQAMELVLNRSSGPIGFSRAVMIKTKSNAGRLAIVYQFRKAKKGDSGDYGPGTAFANTTYIIVNYCPFCKTKLAEDETKEDDETKN